VRTELARGLLPDSVPHADAAANTGRAALLVAALGGEPSLLLRATEDFLHQQQRAPAMPETIALVGDLRSRGIPAVVSGAGPSVLAFVAPGATPAVEDVVAAAPDGWRTWEQAIGGGGACVLT
jgi:homoserine kinase